MEKYRSEFRVEKMCQVLRVSRSGYYKWKTKKISSQAYRKEQVVKRISYHFKDNSGRYGALKITAKLRLEGLTISERTVGKYMRELKLRACVSRKFRVTTTDSNHDHPIAPNLLNQNFKVSQPNKVWVADITYIPCKGQKLYLASIMDLCTREIVGWRLDNHMTTELVMGAFEAAYTTKMPKEGLIHHSDRGTQYTSKEYRAKLKACGMIASMSRRGNCYDNACIESFHSILKKELIYCSPKFKSQQEAYTELYRYIEFFYNRKRIHSSLGYLSPVQFELQFYKKAS
ncbi:IS3 family transposase [Paenibacillus curdlanolyticus]|nr:IS3 family transposase [Paenibacillus curdlanolyticus]